MGLLPHAIHFDADYLRRLREGDAGTARHFSDYFGRLLTYKLVNGVRSPEMLQDVRQETLLRVLEAVRSDTIAQPASLGAFVCTTANHVLWEYRRNLDHRADDGGELPEDAPDPHRSAEQELISEDVKRAVVAVLSGMQEQDRNALRMYFLEERTKSDVCGQLGITTEYFRVVLHRAKARFRKKLLQNTEKSVGA